MTNHLSSSSRKWHLMTIDARALRRTYNWTKNCCWLVEAVISKQWLFRNEFMVSCDVSLRKKLSLFDAQWWTLKRWASLLLQRLKPQCLGVYGPRFKANEKRNGEQRAYDRLLAFYRCGWSTNWSSIGRCQAYKGHYDDYIRSKVKSTDLEQTIFYTMPARWCPTTCCFIRARLIFWRVSS